MRTNAATRSLELYKCGRIFHPKRRSIPEPSHEHWISTSANTNRRPMRQCAFCDSQLRSWTQAQPWAQSKYVCRMATLMSSREIEPEILQLYHADGWARWPSNCIFTVSSPIRSRSQAGIAYVSSDKDLRCSIRTSATFRTHLCATR